MNEPKAFLDFTTVYPETKLIGTNWPISLAIENNRSAAQATNFAASRAQMRQMKKLKSARINEKLKASQKFC